MSPLPVRRTYEFGRAIKTVVTDSGSATMEDTYEVSPVLQAAVTELQQLLGLDAPGKDPKAVIIEEFEALQAQVAAGKAGDDLAERLARIGALLRDL